MINIAIDGPAGAGKSTVAKTIAKYLGIAYLDTGAMYRTVALKATLSDVSISDSFAIIEMLNSLKIEVIYLNGEQHVFLDGVDVSVYIRRHEISKAASDVSKIPEVRLKLVEMQREIAKKSDCVLDGRDTTSFVLPNARYKFFLTASENERARRRFKELHSIGIEISFEQVLKDIRERDYNDTNRDFAPLVQTSDSIFIDSTELNVSEVVEKILSYVKR